MSAVSKPESAPGQVEEERLLQALINRALITQQEASQCQAAAGDAVGPEALLARLVNASFLTPGQAKRVSQELSLFVGQQIPGYQLMEKVGQGSMGIVFKARQISMNRLVAIKILQPRLASNPRDLVRFLNEAHLAAKLSHNNIVQAIDAGSAGKIHYFVMEYIEGTTLNTLVDGGKIFAENEAVEIILQIAQALDHAHRRHLVHRDIKPGNIVITTEGVAKLADLGLAKQTVGEALALDEKGIVRGTPFYIAPEQIQGREDIDIRADIYSLGATLYHLVTGRPPFTAKNVRAIFEAHLHKELTPPDHINTKLSAGLGEVVEFMMAKERDKRYRTPRELIVDLECLLTGEAPRFAHQRIKSAMLQQLAEGETADDDEDVSVDEAPRVPVVWVVVLAVALAASILVNFIFFLRR
jgi:serine/threonine-protein kinase